MGHKFIAALLLLSAGAIAQTVSAPPIVGELWEQKFGFVPGSSTSLVNQDTWLNLIYLDNTTGGSVTVTFADQSTACSAGPCTVWPAVTMAANTVYIAVMHVHAVGGLKWSAGSASSIVGYVSGAYARSLVAKAEPPPRKRKGGTFLAMLHFKRPITSATGSPENQPLIVATDPAFGISSFGGK